MKPTGDYSFLFIVADPKGLNIPWLEVVIAFLVGVLLSAVICCLVIKCHRSVHSVQLNAHISQ